MELFTNIEAVIAVVAGLLIAIFSKKADGVVYGKLDRAGQITNIFLLSVYVCLSPLYIFLSWISSPAHDGFLGILGWIVAFLISTAPVFCFVGLGLSVALRKKGKSKQSFIVQFAGVAGIALTLLLYAVFAGNLLKYLN